MIKLKGSTRFLGSLCFVILYHLVHIQLDFKHRQRKMNLNTHLRASVQITELWGEIVLFEQYQTCGSYYPALIFFKYKWFIFFISGSHLISFNGSQSPHQKIIRLNRALKDYNISYKNFPVKE
nr:hypothetical protein Iba_chr12cCG19200 [Ipomoea batatas]